MARLLGLGPEATQGAAHKKDERTFDRMPTESTMSSLSSGVLKGTQEYSTTQPPAAPLLSLTQSRAVLLLN